MRNDEEGGVRSAEPGSGAARRSPALTAALWVLRVVTAGALAVDAYVHADLAPSYDFTHATISQGMLFRVESGAASLAALLLILAGRRPMTWVFAFLVAAAGLAAVMVYRYIDVGAFGPFPDMYEPLWYAEKTRSAIAEAIATGTSLAGFFLAWHLAGPRRHRHAARGSSRADSLVGSAGE
jgi:hypothetical protein